MPRPPVKRSKLTRPNQATKRVANNPLSSSPAARRRQLHDQLAHKQVGQVPNDSDDSDQLVVKTRSPRNRWGVARQEIYGSGGVAKGDKIAAHKTRAVKRPQVSSKEGPAKASQAKGSRDVAAQPRGVLKTLDHPSSRPSESSKAAPTNPKSSPLGLTSSNPTRLRIGGTPAAETSILGSINPRKRQPSILQSIDGPESSILDQDLDDFLPNDESTPLNGSRKRKLSPTPSASVSAPPAEVTPHRDVVEADTADPEPDLPPPPSSVASRNRQPLAEIDGDTLAPPRSSSSAPSPAKVRLSRLTKNKANIRRTKEPKSLSTTPLQALIPTRRPQRTQRARATRPISEFDIPEDSSDPQNDTLGDQGGVSAAEEESYVASPKATKKSSSLAPRKLQKKPNLSHTNRKTNTKQTQATHGEGRGSIKSRKTSTQPPSITKATTSSSSAAKTSPQQRSSHPTDKVFKIYGRRAVNNLRGGGRTEDDRDEDKENKLSGLFGGSSKRARGWSRRNTNSSTSLAGEGEPLSSDDVEEDTDIEVEVGRGRTNRRSHRGEIDDSNLKDEQARLVEKFKEVDEWEMEFEDVTFDDGGGSDPLAR